MIRGRLLLTAAAATIALQACDKAPPPVDTAAIEKQLRDNEVKWNQAYAARNVDGIVAAYSDDAALANPGLPLLSGKDAIRKETALFAADPNLMVEFAADRVQVAKSGDFAYTRGKYTLTTTDPETRKAEKTSGNYLTVWQKQADGSWKAVEDFITPGPEADGAAAAE